MINPNEAPEGFVAIAPRYGCNGCSFDIDGSCTLEGATCYPSQRKDGKDVIFIPREKSNIVDFAKAKAEFDKLPKSNLAELSNIGDLAEARAEAAKWKLAHDQVCRKFVDCENARDENAKLCEEAQDEAARWKASCLERDELIAKLKSQLTTALESIARMR